MPLIEPKIKKELQDEIIKELKALSKGADKKTVSASHKKLATAIAAAVAKVIVGAITKDAMIGPGIPTAGSPAAQATVAPGKIS